MDEAKNTVEESELDDVTATLNNMQERIDAIERLLNETAKNSKATARRFEDLADAVEYALGDVPVTVTDRVLLEIKRTTKTGIRAGIFFSVVAGVGFGVRAIFR